MNKITPASIEFKENGTPISNHFDDIYFSSDDGIAESEYVFLQHNNLPERWSHFSQKTFTIAETGFGTGLNFLLAWHQFIEFTQRDPDANTKQLHFISFEKFPLCKEDLAKSLSFWPQLAEFSESLLYQYPKARTGCHRLSFANGAVVLDLWFGDVNETLPALHNPENGCIDCWFLDGFAPSKNNDMWSDNLFSHMARLAKKECTFSTFTAAGAVKRGIASAGFTVKKVKGFGRKREMLVGTLTEKLTDTTLPGYQRLPSIIQPDHVAIIGGGLAAANLCYRLALSGIPSTIYCRDALLSQGASGNAQGAIYPSLQKNFSPTTEFNLDAYDYALRCYQQLTADGYMFEHDFCGVAQVAFSDELARRYQALIHDSSVPTATVDWLNQTELENKCGVDLGAGGLFYPEGGWINPASLVDAMIRAARDLVEVTLNFNSDVSALERTEDCKQWLISYGDSNFKHEHIVMCTGAVPSSLTSPHQSHIHPVRGQVSRFVETESTTPIKAVICSKGYLTPSWQGLHCLGASFVKQDTDVTPRDAENLFNLGLLDKCFPDQHWYDAIAISEARASLRATTTDHLPIVGPCPDIPQQRADYDNLKYSSRGDFPSQHIEHGLYMLNGLGARGLTTAPICADILVSQMLGKALPVRQRIASALMPNRFLVREITRTVVTK